VIENPLAKATLACLHEMRPQAVSFDELRAAVRVRLRQATEPVSDHELDSGIAIALRHCVWPRLVELCVHPVTFNTVVGERPVASPVARYQAKTSDRVTNPQHESVALAPLERQVLLLLDGQRDRAALLDLLAASAETEPTSIVRDGRPVRDRSAIRSILAEQLDTALTVLATRGLIQ
jgi:hypothetical protein